MNDRDDQDSTSDHMRLQIYRFNADELSKTLGSKSTESAVITQVPLPATLQV